MVLSGQALRHEAVFMPKSSGEALLPGVEEGYLEADHEHEGELSSYRCHSGHESHPQNQTYG